MKAVVVICGGRSAEHEVSIMSAKTVVTELARKGFPVQLVGIDLRGRTMTPEELTNHFPDLPKGVEVPSCVSWITHLCDLSPESTVIFPVLHGPYGEDGTIQGFFELLRIPYVGSGVGASAVGMNKIYTKRLLISEGIPVLPFTTLNQKNWEQNRAEHLER